MPEKACVPEAALSDKQRELNANNRSKHNPRQEYLLQTMWDKKGYVVYGEMLQHGVQMTHIYCIIIFRVANWLKPYIELNTKLRNEAKRTGNALGITVFKGMNNFIYGKVPAECLQAKQPEVPQHNRRRNLHSEHARVHEEHLPQWKLHIYRGRRYTGSPLTSLLPLKSAGFCYLFSDVKFFIKSFSS